MDRTVIADAVYQALAGGVKIKDVFDTVAGSLRQRRRRRPDHDLLEPSSSKYGADAFARDLASAGGAGLITLDLTPEEAGRWLAASDTARPGPRFPGEHRPLPPARVEAIAGGPCPPGWVYAGVGLMDHHRRQGRGQRGRRPAWSPASAEHADPAGRGRPRAYYTTGAQARRGRPASPTA